LYNLKNDPHEKKNLFKTQEGINGIRRELISKLLGIKQEKAEVQEEVVLNEKDIQDIKALGYIQ